MLNLARFLLLHDGAPPAKDLAGAAAAQAAAAAAAALAKPLAGAATGRAAATGALQLNSEPPPEVAHLALNLARLEHSAVLEFYELDATVVGGSVLTFHNGRNGLGGAVVWQGITYQPFPIEAEGFELSGQGPMPRPTLRVANVLGLIGVLVRDYRGLKGAKLTRRRTLAKYLDAVNFPGGVNPSADPNAHYPDDVFTVDRQAQRDRAVAVFELASAIDVQGVPLPRRQIVHGYCPWIYRGTDCGYTGAPVAKEDDTPTALLAEDRCGHRLASCRLRPWPGNELPFGGFPGAGVMRNA